jgi:CheY-like chemotaxis protein
VDGTEVIFTLNAMPQRPAIIAISGGGAGVSADEALRLARFKADAFIEKPFDRAAFLAIVSRLLNKAA